MEPTLITSVQRALRLVGEVEAASSPLSAKVLARRTGLTLGTTYNLLRTLVHEGYLVAEPDGYVLGADHPGLGDRGAGVALARSRTAMKELRDTVHAPAYLTTYEDGEVRIIDIVDGQRTPRLDLWVGVHDSAHATAFGKCILAQLTPDLRDDYLARHQLADLTPHTIHDSRTLLRQLEASHTVTTDQQEYTLGYTCMAVPVPNINGALAVSFPVEHRAAGRTVVDAMRAAARSIAVHHLKSDT